jgi:hypothetical protein
LYVKAIQRSAEWVALEQRKVRPNATHHPGQRAADKFGSNHGFQTIYSTILQDYLSQMVLPSHQQAINRFYG